MLQHDLQESAEEVGKVESLNTAYRRLKSNYDFQTRQLRAARADKIRFEREAQSCATEKKQKARFYDRRLLHPVVSVAPTPWAIATLLATLITIDRQTAQARRALPGLRFEKDKGVDLFSAPSETNQARVGDCAKFVRQEGAFRGVAVGCARVPGGFHVWLQGSQGEVIDVCVDRGMQPVPAAVYATGVYAPIAGQIKLGALGALADVSQEAADDYTEMESMFELPWDQESPWPTIEDASADIFGVEFADDSSDGQNQNVAGTASTIASIVGVAGTIGAALATAYGGPALGATVSGVANATAGAIAQIEQEVPKGLPRKERRRAVARAAASHLSKARAAGPSGAPAGKGLRFDATAVAMVAATSEDPKVIAKVRARLKTDRNKDPNPQYRMALEAAVLGLHSAGYDLPIVDKPQDEAAESFIYEPPEVSEHVEGFEMVPEYVPDCPGTCGV